MTAHRLAPEYDCCLLGATVNLHGNDQFAYSLRKLIRFEMTRGDCPASKARVTIAQDLVIPIQREHGPEAPIFIDDELVQGEIEEDEPRIIVPNFNGKPRG